MVRHLLSTVMLLTGNAEDLRMVSDESLELLTVGTAIHYFDCKVFFKELDRVLKPGGCFAQYGYINYYNEPCNLGFDVLGNPSRTEALSKCNELMVEIFQAVLEQKGYVPCLAMDNVGVEPPYAEVDRQILNLDHPCNVDSLLEYLQSLGLWQSYCLEKSIDSDKLVKQYKERFLSILREITDTPEKMPMKLRMGLFLIIARKPCIPTA